MPFYLSLANYPTRATLNALDAIAQHIAARGSAPTLRELAERLGISSRSAVREHVIRLAKLELVTCERIGKRKYLAARTLRLTGPGQSLVLTYRARQSSEIFLGYRKLRLSAREMDIARRAGVPVDTFFWQTKDGQFLLRCSDRKERDFWGDAILEALEEHAGSEQEIAPLETRRANF